MTVNWQHVTTGWGILIGVLAPYVVRELRNHYGSEWWRRGVLSVLSDSQKRDLPEGGRDSELTAKLDILCCLILMDRQWDIVFRRKHDRLHRAWVNELIPTRNRWAHKGLGDFTSEDAWRALDTMARLTEKIAREATEQLHMLAHTVRYGAIETSTATHEKPVKIDARNPRLSQADRIRQYVIEFCVKPWSRSGEKQLSIRASDVERGMRLHGRTPNICQALKGHKLQKEARIVLIGHTEPCPSTTTVFRYRRDSVSP